MKEEAHHTSFTRLHSSSNLYKDYICKLLSYTQFEMEICERRTVIYYPRRREWKIIEETYKARAITNCWWLSHVKDFELSIVSMHKTNIRDEQIFVDRVELLFRRDEFNSLQFILFTSLLSIQCNKK